MHAEQADARAMSDATVIRGAGAAEAADARGRFDVICLGPDGAEKWRDTFDNVVCTEGKNFALDTFLAGAGYTVAGPFIGLISSTSFSAVAAADTMASHAGWLEAGGANAPTYSGNRATASWSAAASGAKALVSPAAFSITGSGTVKGAFLCYGTGAVATKDSAAGKLWSAGLFSGGDKSVTSGDTLNVSYSSSL